jgi:hypothetical protein
MIGGYIDTSKDSPLIKEKDCTEMTYPTSHPLLHVFVAMGMFLQDIA